VAVVEIPHIAGGVCLVFQWSSQLWSGLWHILIALLVLVLLCSRKPDEFFPPRHAP
jgi:hypothetical protein